MAFKSTCIWLSISLAVFLGTGHAYQVLPSFDRLKSGYPGYFQYTTSAEVKALIGGNVNVGYIDNTCSVRMSRALNQVGGHDITQAQYDPSEGRYDSVRGADGKQYIFRVTGLGRYLENTYGPPITGYWRSDFRNKKGIMRLNLPGSRSYTGHFALWDGSGFYQSYDYFHEATKPVYLWITTEPISGGCFPAHAKVNEVSKGTISSKDIEVGDKLLSVDDEGKLLYSDVIGWLHREEDVVAEFYEIRTTNGNAITLTGNHIIFKMNAKGIERTQSFASAIQVGDYLLTQVKSKNFNVTKAIVTSITRSAYRGIYAPLTREGTVVVDHVAASCYAAINDHALAHAALFPVRAAHALLPSAFGKSSGYLQNYLDVLQLTARLVLSKKKFHANYHQQ